MVQGPPELKPHPAALLVVRFGLPIVVGIHYLTAARGFAFTPDEAFGAVHAALFFSSGDAGGTAAGMFSPLWALLLGAGVSLELDPVTTAKVLSLVFSSLGIIAVYLVAVEALEDRVLAFLTALAAGLEPWLLAAAPGGTPYSLLFALTFAAWFFMKRGDFAIGGILIGLAGLVSWPALGLLSVFVAEVLTSERSNHPRQTIAAGALLTAATIAAWVLFAFTRSLPIFPGMDVPGNALPASFFQGILLLVAGGMTWWGWRSVRRLPLLRLVFPGSRASVAAFLAWGAICAVAFSSSYLLLLGPVCVILVIDGIRKSFASMYREPISYFPALIGIALLIVLHQALFFASVRPSMERAAEEGREVEAIAAWLRTNVPPKTAVGAEPDCRLSYLLRADLPVGKISEENPQPVIVERHLPGGGYAEAYRPMEGTGLAVYRLIPREYQQ